MSGGGGDGGASQARKDEQARQDQIRQGTQQINSIFDGGQYATGRIGQDARYDPNAVYYNLDGTRWNATPYRQYETSVSTGLGGDAGIGWETRLVDEGTPYDKQFASALSNGLYTGVGNSPGQFNDEFFNRQRQNYLDYAMPQLDQQYADAQKELTYSLARSGLLDSSARSAKEGELKRLYDTNAQQIADQALASSTKSRNAVESARSDLISTLNATGDVTGAVNSATARASALSQPEAYSPLGQMFGNFLQGIGTQAALERADYMTGGQIRPTYQTGLFSPSNSVQVSR